MAPVEPQLTAFYNKFKNMFDPIAEFDLDWSKRSILDILSSYRWGHVFRASVSGDERDFIMLVWRSMDISVLWIKRVLIFNRNDQQSAAGSTRCNENGVADDDSNIGAGENGYADEAGVGTKEIAEKMLKLPKTLKDMALRLASAVDNEEKKIRKIQVVGVIYIQDPR
ncbi:hypothetical protein INT45_011153 [Circinella minor]|uniref:Uncharacterized protein n=1 Tax=Circinella minor TaxID=1195481 RepID=A0A8H7SHJ1_9FUNG|nr:hypothetical protein INT45_011153 [Circinella minor]